MPAYAHPVVEGLDGEVHVLRCFKLENREFARAGNSEEVDELALASSEGENLAVHRVGPQRGVESLQIQANRTFEPALGKNGNFAGGRQSG